MVDWRPDADQAVWRRRASLYRSIRAFFDQRGVLEVETPALSSAAVTDPHIHSVQTTLKGCPHPVYLHTSPEFPMKRLLAAGSGDIYQLCKVFRQGERGRRHNPEFTLLEWYRCGLDHHQLMDEMIELFSAISPELCRADADKIDYHRAFKKYADIDVSADEASIRNILAASDATPPENLSGKTECLDWAMGALVAPHFASDRLTFLYDYPANQAALARIRHDSPPIAERFEVYWGELELANGFHELADADEQLARFQNELAERRQIGLHTPAIDMHLIGALAAGFPNCAGVALGIDRLLMACLGKSTIDEVLAFGFGRA